MNNYINIGYDIWPEPEYCNQFKNSTTWERDEVYDEVRTSTGIEENFFQLLNPKNNKELNYLTENVKNTIENYTLILVSIEKSVFNLQKNKVSSIEPTIIDNLSISLIGFDICDINGFFSVFDMGIECFSRINLLEEKEVEEGINIILLANELIPEHAPFYIVKLYKVT